MDEEDTSFTEIANAVVGSQWPDYFEQYPLWDGVRVQLLWCHPLSALDTGSLDIYVHAHTSWGPGTAATQIYEIEVHETASTALSAVLGFFQRASAYFF